MFTEREPFNVDILDVTSDQVRSLPIVTSLDIMDGATTNFNPDGLFSIEKFGRIGDPKRDRQFGQILLKAHIIHHVIYKVLVRSKALYAAIMNGTQYAIWDDKEKDFIPSNAMDGKTGYGFFIKKIDDLELKTNKSPVRQMRVKLLEKYKGRLTMDRILVGPAGLREVEIGADGHITTPEINYYYRRLISASNNIIRATDVDNPILDNVRRNMQTVANSLFDFILNMLSGKHGFIQDKFAARRIHNGTANVITGMVPERARLDSPKSLTLDQHIVGFYQQFKGIGGLGVNMLMRGPLERIFSQTNMTGRLVDTKTLTSSMADVSHDSYNLFNTIEGLEKIINRCSVPALRNKPLLLDGKYLALIYRDGKYFRVISDINELPAGYSKENVKPITLIELMYVSSYRKISKYPATMTRYPIATIGSHFASFSYVKTTIRGEVLEELDEQWQPMGEEYKAYEFPKLNEAYVDSLIPNATRLEGLGGDYDGDRCNLNVICSDEAIAEQERLSHTRENYLLQNGKLKTSLWFHTTELLMRNVTGVRKSN